MDEVQLTQMTRKTSKTGTSAGRHHIDAANEATGGRDRAVRLT